MSLVVSRTILKPPDATGQRHLDSGGSYIDRGDEAYPMMNLISMSSTERAQAEDWPAATSSFRWNPKFDLVRGLVISATAVVIASWVRSQVH